MSQLQILGAGGKVIIVFAVFFLCVEIIKGWKVLWEFLAPKFLGIKTELSRRKDLEELTLKNADNLNNIVRQQEEANQQTLAIVNKISEDVTALKNEVDVRFSTIDGSMATLSDTVQDMQLESMRNTILNFGAGVGNNRLYSREQYDYIKKIYGIYHRIIRETGKSNDEIEITMNKIVLPSYERHIEKHDFLEYMISDDSINKTFSDEIKQRKSRKKSSISEDDSNETPKKPSRRRRKNTTDDNV